MEPEARHRLCWYGRRTGEVLPDVNYQTVEDGGLLYCAHPMLFPVVGYRFDVRNCDGCEYFRQRRLVARADTPMPARRGDGEFP